MLRVQAPIAALVAVLIAADACNRRLALPSPDALARHATIRRDSFGIPHILADSEEAAAFAFGYAQAEDHAVEIGRRLIAARGEAARVFGTPYLDNDVVMAQFDNIAEARRGLGAVATVCADPKALALARACDLPERFPRDFFEERDGGLQVKSGWKEYAADLRERSRRAWRAIGDRPLDPPDGPPGTALAAAALLFDAGLYYEVHELLEPYWLRADGGDREALQGLIQVAVGFEHLANGNVIGARALLADGCAKTLDRRLHGLDLGPFTRTARACLDRVVAHGATAAREFDWAAVPRFPV